MLASRLRLRNMSTLPFWSFGMLSKICIDMTRSCGGHVKASEAPKAPFSQACHRRKMKFTQAGKAFPASSRSLEGNQNTGHIGNFEAANSNTRAA
eukprot:scaffold225065_cov19-Tisochrysis_lutea.AAC.2